MVYGRNAVESGARDTRISHNHSLGQYFEGRQISLKYKPKKKKDEDSTDDYEDDTVDINIDDDGLIEVVMPVVVCSHVKGSISMVG